MECLFLACWNRKLIAGLYKTLIITNKYITIGITEYAEQACPIVEHMLLRKKWCRTDGMIIVVRFLRRKQIENTHYLAGWSSVVVFRAWWNAVIIRRLYTSSVADGKDGRKRRTETADGNSRRKWPTENQRIFHGPVDRLDERLVSGWHLRCAHNKCHLRILMEMRGSGQTHLLWPCQRTKQLKLHHS